MDSLPHLSVILLEFRRKTTGQPNCQSDNCQEEGDGEEEEEKVVSFAMEATKQIHNKIATTMKKSSRSSRASKNE